MRKSNDHEYTPVTVCKDFIIDFGSKDSAVSDKATSQSVFPIFGKILDIWIYLSNISIRGKACSKKIMHPENIRTKGQGENFKERGPGRRSHERGQTRT